MQTMRKIIKGLKISALATTVAGLTGCNEPQHPVYGFTQLDVGFAIMIVLLLAIVGMWLWSVAGLIDFRKNLTNQSYRGEFFQWSNVNVNIPGTENSNEQK